MKHNLYGRAADLFALPPAAKMELADRLYDHAVGECEATGEWPAVKRPTGGGRPAVVDDDYGIEPWQGFAERLRHR